MSCGLGVKNALRDKMIIHSQYDGYLKELNKNAFFFVSTRDSVWYVYTRYDIEGNKLVSGEEKVDSFGNTVFVPSFGIDAPWSNEPYHLSREEGKIFVSYINDQDIPRKHLFYSLDKKDSIPIFDLMNICNRLYLSGEGLSVYSGRDTTIRCNNLRFKCWIFLEYYGGDLRNGRTKRKSTVYIDKKTLLEIRRKNEFFNDEAYQSLVRDADISTISMILPYDSSRFRRGSCSARRRGE